MTDKYLPKKGQKGHYIFICETCNFECSNKSKYNRHLLTAKHKILTNTDEKGPQRSNPLFFCECGKKYNERSYYT